jgi:hypothetical protein
MGSAPWRSHGGVSGTPEAMSDTADPSDLRNSPTPPKLPDVESPPPEHVLDGVPSKEEVVEHAQPAEEVVDGQPSVDEILGHDR